MEKKSTKNIVIIILSIVLFLLALFVIKFIYNAIILNKLSKLAMEQFNYTNYSYYIKTSGSSSVGETIAYVKGENYLVETLNVDLLKSKKITGYYDGKDEIYIQEDGESKEAIINGKNTSDESFQANASSIKSFYTASNFENWTNFSTILSSKISSETYKGKPCYLLDFGEIKVWIDKDTGLILRRVTAGNSTDFTFNFEKVTDEMIVKPDISEFKV